jgi:hypothetical protein
MGSVRRKVLPAPTLLATLTSPPSSRASLRVTLRPRPVPPVLLVAACSACQKGSNTSSMLSAAMPTPVSGYALQNRGRHRAATHLTHVGELDAVGARFTSIRRSFVPLSESP